MESNILANVLAILKPARFVTALTGAGVSAESGVPTFRGSDGLWEGHAITEVASPDGFRRDPGLVWKFYNLRRAGLKSVAPNPGHDALAAMEKHYEQRFRIITQNVDGLHREAGSTQIFELHGNLRHVHCTACDYAEEIGLVDLPPLPKCPKCGSLIRPSIVWFGEMLPGDQWRGATKAIEMCDVLLVIGTSAVVYPAAGLIDTAKKLGKKIIEFNIAETDASALADIFVPGPSGVNLKAIAQGLGIAIN